MDALHTIMAIVAIGLLVYLSVVAGTAGFTAVLVLLVILFGGASLVTRFTSR